MYMSLYLRPRPPDAVTARVGDVDVHVVEEVGGQAEAEYRVRQLTEISQN